jgi:hypothetical protein
MFPGMRATCRPGYEFTSRCRRTLLPTGGRSLNDKLARPELLGVTSEVPMPKHFLSGYSPTILSFGCCFDSVIIHVYLKT